MLHNDRRHYLHGRGCDLCPLELARVSPAHARLPSPVRTQLWGRVPAVSTADLTGLLVVAFPVGTVLLVPASARSSWRRPLMPFVPSRYRHHPPHGRAPPSEGGLTHSVLCIARPASPSLPLVWPISVSHVLTDP